MIGIYFSGTGNTKYCVSQFLIYYNDKKENEIYSIEDKNCISKIKESKDIVLAYPIYYSDIPIIVKDFLNNNKDVFKDKNIFLIATMGLFSGDGTGCSARLLKRYGANIIGGLHLKMPDCIGDVKLLKKSLAENRKTILKAEHKMDLAVNRINNGKFPKEGLNFFYRIAGVFGQRLYFSGKTKHYFTKIRTDESKCVKCGLCVSLCPTANIVIEDKVVYRGKCTMCYRCFANCPKKAITIIGKHVYEQYKFDNYKK